MCTNISITNDEISEPTDEEMFEVVIQISPSPLNPELGPNPVSIVTIVDDDGKWA